MGSKSVEKKASKKVEKVEKAAPKVEKKEKKSKKVVKEPTPSESSDSDSSSDEEEEKPKAAAKKEESSDSDSSDSDSSDSEDEKPAAKKAESSSDSDSDSSSDEEEAPKKDVEVKESSTTTSEDSSDSDSSSDEEEEKPAAATNGKRKAEEEVEVAPAAPKKAKTEEDGEATATVFVGGLSWNIDNDWLASEFASCGEVVSARVMLDRESGKSRGFGYVEFADLESSAKAIEFDGKEIDGRQVRCNYAQVRAPNPEKRAQAFNDKQSPPAETLWVGSLSFDITEDQVYEAFGEFGDVQSVRLPTDRETGAPKGFGYIQFADVAQATAALNGLNGQELAGRRLRIDFAPPKNNDGGERSGGFGGRGGGRGGFGGRGGGRGGGGRGGGRGGFGGDRGFGGRGGGRGGRGGPPRSGGARTGGIQASTGSKISFD